MISAFSQNSEFTKAITTFCGMCDSGESPNQFAFSSVIQACSSLKSVQIGTQIHCLALKAGFSYELFVGSNLADMYSKCGSIIEACMVFEEMPSKDEVSWNSMINGYAKNGYNEEALVSFKKMLIEDVTIDQHLVCSTLCACGPLKAYNIGSSLHSFVTKLGFEQHNSVGNALMDMYFKLGDMDSGSQLLKINSKGTNIISYTSLIDGLIKACANHVTLKQGVQLHALVLKYNLDQDPFVSSIIVDMYGKCGLLDHSLQAFDKISKPNEFTWNSLIGKLKEAENFIKSMPFEANAYTWCSFLASCRKCGNKERGELASKSLKIIDPLNSGAHVLLSNIYAKEQQWEDVKSVRKMMKDENVKKVKGCSWVDVDKRVHVFGVEDLCHGDKKEIDLKLDEVLRKIIEVGYVPDVDSVPFDLDYDMKVKILNHHSERIDIAYALIRIPIGKPIIVKENIRVCVDCHSAIKLMSKVEGGEIIVRDNSRFHHFVDRLQ
ncbi:unnamed protein product [Lactuca virosa]|uniref:DYW domain-containing protein n=1 Tax=Lactuca virosa TaxID=75947 RepID=A0AAU9MZ54_9ASTR|nr:unnamed protein product [Lactuca virosa]